MSLVSQRGGCSPSPQDGRCIGEGSGTQNTVRVWGEAGRGKQKGDSIGLLMLREQEVLGREESRHPGVWEKWKPESVF